MERYYFSYGSNLCQEQMKERCSTAFSIGKAVLSNYQLCFDEYSARWGGGAATIEKKTNQQVVGAIFIFYLAYKNFHSQLSQNTFDFNWKVMFVLGWSNPKIWTTVPAGALSANYSESLIVNMLGFYFIALPIFLVGVFFWATIGKQGNKIAPKKFGYFTAFLLIGFGIYLIYKGIISIT